MKNIISAPMNQVYSREYVEACIDADITPGIFMGDNSIPEEDLIDFKDYLYVSLPVNYVRTHDISKYKFKTIELLGWNGWKLSEMIDICAKIQDSGTKVVFKNWKPEIAPIILCKGNEGAGLTSNDSLFSDFNNLKSQYPNKEILVSGGIYSSTQVKYYLTNGATACLIGTLFASCKESPLCLEAKKMLIKSAYYHTKKFPQNGLQLSNFNKTDFNNTKELRMGVTTGKKGVIYAGRALDFIKEIRPLKDIVNDLRSEL
jgi:NAD(P)H-dependent flavin oxidoreductase YrpB (nitropropane dioxygenase family)